MVLDGELVPLLHFWPAKRPPEIPRDDKSDDEWDKDYNWDLYKDAGEDKKNKFRLPYSVGQKYTFGTKFISREEQGELIFSRGREYLKDPDDPFVCQIVCEEDKYWVSSSRKNKIFINDVEITTKTELGFGDVLSLMEMDKESKNYSNYCSLPRFLFKEWQLSPGKDFDSLDNDSWTGELNTLVLEETSDDINSKSLVGQNALVISKILSYLPLKDIKRARLVSKTWNSEAIPFIKIGASAQLKICAYNNVQTTMKLFLFCNDFKDNPGLVQKLKLILPRFPSTHMCWRYPLTLNSNDGAEGTKFTSDIHWFLGQVSNVTELNLNGSIVNSQEDFDIHIAIMEKFAGSLKKLELSGTWMKYRTEEESDYNSFRFPATLKFPKLKSFSWSISFTVEKHNIMLPQYYFRKQPVNYNSSNFDYIRDLIQAVSGVKELRIWAEPELGNFLSRKLDSFRNLEQLSLCHVIPAELKGKILEIRNPLKKLSWDNLTPDDIPFLEERSHASSLETLKFGLPYEGGLRRRDNKFFIPTLPKLKSLSIEYYDWNHSNLVFGEPPGIIEYASHFPCLRSLTLKGDTVEFLGIFIPFYNREQDPGDQQVCRTLQYLDLHHQHVSLKPGIKKAEVAKMFPNVRNNWVDKVEDWEDDGWW